MSLIRRVNHAIHNDVSCPSIDSLEHRGYVLFLWETDAVSAVDQKAAYAKIVVTFETRSDGGLRAYSDDVPGFVLSHADCEAVLADVKPALETILTYMMGGRVVVSPLPRLREQLTEAGVITPSLPAPRTLEYVTHIQG